MGAVEAKLGNLSQRLLMPAEAPAHFAHGRPSSFPKCPENSLLLLSHVALATADKQKSLDFYVTGLGGGFLPEEKGIRIHAGVTQLHLHPDGMLDGSQLAQVWPGHMYCWVKDAHAVVNACQSLDPAIIEGVHHLTDEKVIDAVVLQEPSVENRIVINPAPKGGLVGKIESLGSQADERKTTNLLAIMDATHLIAPGTGEAVKRCYEHFLATTVSRKRGGYVLHFSLGQSLQQTLTFVEHESVPPLKLGLPVPGICIYMPSTELFETCFQRCSDAGILKGPSTLKEAKEASEFRFQQCMDPETKDVTLELLHIVRLQQHAECPLPEGFVVQRETIAPELVIDTPFTELTLPEVAVHNTPEDAWVVINGRVYDVTDWVGVHPWHIIMGDYGKDISAQWNIVHAPGTWEDDLAYPKGPRVLGYVQSASNPRHSPLAGA